MPHNKHVTSTHRMALLQVPKPLSGRAGLWLHHTLPQEPEGKGAPERGTIYASFRVFLSGPTRIPPPHPVPTSPFLRGIFLQQHSSVPLLSPPP